MNLIVLLRAVNSRFEAFLGRHACAADGSQDSWILPEELREIRHCLTQVDLQIKGRSLTSDEVLKPELAKYVHNLEQLQPMLQTAQEWLIEKRNRLDQSRAHLQTVAAWTSACKATL